MKQILSLTRRSTMVGLLIVSCRDEESFESLVASLESPTGVVSADSVVDVAHAYEQALLAPISAFRAFYGGGDDAAVCPSGGSINVESDTRRRRQSATITYDNCCVEIDVCLDGEIGQYYSSESSAAYQYCASYDLSVTAAYLGGVFWLRSTVCLSVSGLSLYGIDIESGTFTVSGDYYAGEGTLEIRGDNGAWSCTFRDDHGSCTYAGETFSF